MTDLYPCTITRSRYGGVYEKGSWIAFLGDEIPAAAVGEDNECDAFWEAAREARRTDIAVGETANGAYEVLKALQPKPQTWVVTYREAVEGEKVLERSSDGMPYVTRPMFIGKELVVAGGL